MRTTAKKPRVLYFSSKQKEQQPNLTESLNLHTVVAAIVHVSDFHLVRFLIEGDDLRSPPRSLHRRSCTNHTDWQTDKMEVSRGEMHRLSP